MRSLFSLFLLFFSVVLAQAQSYMKKSADNSNASAAMPFSILNYAIGSNTLTKSINPVPMTGPGYVEGNLYNHEIVWNATRWEFISQSGTDASTRIVRAINEISAFGDDVFIDGASQSFFFAPAKYPGCEGWKGIEEYKMTGACMQVAKINATGGLAIYNGTVLIEKRTAIPSSYSSFVGKINGKSRYVGKVGSDSLQEYFDGTKWVFQKKPANSNDAWNLRVAATWSNLATSGIGTALPPINGWVADAAFSGSTMTQGGTVSALPVNLVSFDAKAQSNKTVKISWKTTEEINAAYFAVERSRDSKTFTEITRVETAANSSVLKEYAVIDRSPSFGTNYYRLRQVDLDGKSQVFRIVSTTVSDQDQPFGAFPNPAGSAQFSIKVENANEAKVMLYDILGRNLAVVAEKESDHVLVIKPKGALQPGIYLAEVKNIAGTYTHKVLIK